MLRERPVANAGTVRDIAWEVVAMFLSVRSVLVTSEGELLCESIGADVEAAKDIAWEVVARCKFIGVVLGVLHALVFV